MPGAGGNAMQCSALLGPSIDILALAVPSWRLVGDAESGTQLVPDLRLQAGRLVIVPLKVTQRNLQHWAGELVNFTLSGT